MGPRHPWVFSLLFVNSGDKQEHLQSFLPLAPLKPKKPASVPPIISVPFWSVVLRFTLSFTPGSKALQRRGEVSLFGDQNFSGRRLGKKTGEGPCSYKKQESFNLPHTHQKKKHSRAFLPVRPSHPPPSRMNA